MRLHRLRMQAFLAFAGEEVVDFDELSAGGLFLLQGRTGAGKSAVLDAVVFALYGDVSGDRGDRLRADHAAGDVRSEVELELTLRGRRLRILRRPPQERPSLRGDGVVRAGHEVTIVEVGPGGAELPVAGTPSEARTVLGELVGLSRAQFCQVVLLPQGRFAEFLHATSQDRGELLRDLFDLGRFADAEAWLKARARDAERRLAEAQRGVRDALSRAAQVSGAELPEDLDRDPEAASAWLEDAIVLAEASAATATAGCEAARAAATRAREALDAGSRLAEAREAAADARQELADHRAGSGEQETRRAALDAARRAAPCAQAALALERAAAEQEAAQARAAAARAAAPLEEEAAPSLFDLDGRGETDRLRARAQGLRTAAGSVAAHAPREERVREGRAALDRAKAAAATAGERIREVTAALEAGAAQRTGLVAAVDGARSAAERLPGLQDAAARAQDRAAASSRRDELTAASRAAEEAVRTAQAAHLAAREHAVALREARTAAAATALAAALRPGEPCAVCGSTEHPAPAPSTLPDGTAVPDEAALEWADAAAAEAEQAVRDAQEEQGRVAVALAEARAVAGDDGAEALAAAQRKAAADLAQARVEAGRLEEAQAALAAAEAGTTRLEEERRAAEVEHATATEAAVRLAGELAEDERLLAEVRGQCATIADRVAELEGLAALADEAVEAVEAEARAVAAADAARATARRLAREHGFADEASVRAAVLAPEQVAALEETVQAWDARLADLGGRAAQLEDAVVRAEPAWRAALAALEPDRAAGEDAARRDAELLEAAGLRGFAGTRPGGGELAAPDVEALREAAEAAEARATEAERAAARSGGRHEELMALRGTLAERLREAEPARRRYVLLRDLSDLANGAGSANRLSMRLSAYVLAARLEEVAAAASLRLERMSEGRFTLEHADDGGSGNRRGGLDLRVVDAWTGTARRPSSLSGGETFLASLALALGLADVVTAEAGGTHLETLFVDEGFGALDDEGTLDQVLDVLEDLREGGRVVGVVSHVAELRRRIPTQLRVERGMTGSTVRQHVAAGAA